MTGRTDTPACAGRKLREAKIRLPQPFIRTDSPPKTTDIYIMV